MKRPWAVEVPAPRDTETRSGPGKSAVRFVSVFLGIGDGELRNVV